MFILLSNTGTLLNKGIKIYTKAPYNHASISFNRELTELYSFGRIYPRNPLIGGVVKEDIHGGTFDLFPNTTCMVYEFPLDRTQKQKMRDIVQYFEENKTELKFNITGLLGIVLQRPVYRRQDSYFCSQFVSELFIQTGLLLLHQKIFEKRKNSACCMKED